MRLSDGWAIPGAWFGVERNVRRGALHCNEVSAAVDLCGHKYYPELGVLQLFTSDNRVKAIRAGANPLRCLFQFERTDSREPILSYVHSEERLGPQDRAACILVRRSRRRPGQFLALAFSCCWHSEVECRTAIPAGDQVHDRIPLFVLQSGLPNKTISDYPAWEPKSLVEHSLFQPVFQSIRCGEFHRR